MDILDVGIHPENTWATLVLVIAVEEKEEELAALQSNFAGANYKWMIEAQKFDLEQARTALEDHRREALAQWHLEEGTKIAGKE